MSKTVELEKKVALLEVDIVIDVYLLCLLTPAYFCKDSDSVDLPSGWMFFSKSRAARYGSS